MSGFFGMLRFDDQPVDPRLLQKISSEMSFRGPHGTNVWNQDQLGGCFALMRTGPAPQAPEQPVTWDDRFWLWGDIRLDARADLAKQLAQQDGPSCANPSNEELLLGAWAKWGPAALEYIIGDFSFALWDAKERVFWCARDFIGARPFYYARVPGAFCFSNTLQVLRLVPEVSAALDESFVGDFLLDGWSSEPFRTVYQDIRRLCAGHLLKLTKDTVDVRRFRKLPIEDPLRLSRPEEYLEAYRDLLKAAVSDRLPDGPTALYLSGGLDSGSVCATTSRLACDRGQQGNLKAFTVSCRPFFDDPEPVYAGFTSAHLGLAQEILEEPGLHPYEHAESKQGWPPEPDDDIFFARGQRILGRIASHSNVVLSGDGGDNVLTGQSWPYLTHLCRQGRWQVIAREFGGYLWSQKRIPPIRGGFRTRIFQFFNFKDPFADYPNWLEPAFEARANLRQRWMASRNLTRNPEHPLHPQAYQALHGGYWAAMLETEEAGWNRVLLETRAPLMDLRLLGFLFRLPPVPWCMNKQLCREAMKDFLPYKIVRRPKTPLLMNPFENSVKRGDWTAPLLNAVPAQTVGFVNWRKWCETLDRSKGSLRLSTLRPASLFFWLKAVETV